MTKRDCSRDTLDDDTGEDLGDTLWEAARFLSEEAGIISTNRSGHEAIEDMFIEV